jgi:hypothetical protein
MSTPHADDEAPVRRAVIARRLAHADPGGLLYGALVSASVLITASAHIGDYQHVALTTLTALTVYWLAHAYIGAQSMQFEGDSRHALHRVAAALGHEASVLKGGLPAVVVFVTAVLVGVEEGTAASLAAYFSVALIVLAGYLASHRVGRTGLALVIDTSLAALLGLVVIIGKVLLH